VVGLLVGPSAFGLLLEAFDGYAAPWAAFAGLATLVATTMLVAGPAIDRARGLR
jgi:cyanate permease